MSEENAPARGHVVHAIFQGMGRRNCVAPKRKDAQRQPARIQEISRAVQRKAQQNNANSHKASSVRPIVSISQRECWRDIQAGSRCNDDLAPHRARYVPVSS